MQWVCRGMSHPRYVPRDKVDPYASFDYVMRLKSFHGPFYCVHVLAEESTLPPKVVPALDVFRMVPSSGLGMVPWKKVLGV